MELRDWKILLLNWVKECNFISNFTALEDSDIEEFYVAYAEHAQVDSSPESSSPPGLPLSNSTIAPAPLQLFLKEFYPDFQPHLDDEGHVLTSDYVYVYTLLMHYTCVLNPRTYFHNLCQNLPESAQHCIAMFLQETVNGPKLTRTNLRQLIVNTKNAATDHNFLVPSTVVVPSDVTPPARTSACATAPITPVQIKHSADGISNNSPIITNGNGSGKTLSSTLTPVHQNRLNDSIICTPSTPKSELLEQRTRELLGLRAQLETERYEKAVLEEQIVQNEHLINSLSKENTVKKKQLSKLKASLQNENEDDDDDIYMRKYIPNEFENLKRRLMKELGEKDTILAENNEQLQELKAEHEKLINKLKMSETQVMVCMDRISDLELRIESGRELSDEKDNQIASLEADKLELERCLQEIRDEMHNGREVLNASSDLLDTSQLQSSMNTTPENLASSVVDKQLREKELENVQLREQLASTVEEKSRTVDEVLQLIQQHHLEIPVQPLEKTQPHLLQLIERSMHQLSLCTEQEKQRVQELQSQYSSMLGKCGSQSDHIAQLTDQIRCLDLQLAESHSNIMVANEKLQQSQQEFEQKVNDYLETIAKKDHENDHLKAKLESVLHNIDELESKLKLANGKLIQLEQEITSSTEKFNLENANKIQLEQQLESVRQELSSQSSVQIRIGDELDSVKQKHHLLEIDIEAKNNLIEKLKKTQAEFETDKQAQSKLLRNLEARVRELFTTCNMDSADNCITIDDILANIERMYLDLQKNETKLIIDRDRTNEQLQQEIHDRIQAKNQLHNKDLELNSVKQKLIEIENTNQQLLTVGQQSQQEFEQKVKDYLETIAKKDQENDHLKAKLERVLHNLDEHKSAQSELESKLKLANGKLIQLEQEITASTEKFNLENANKIELEQQLESVRQELSSQSSVQIRIGDELDSVKQKHHLLEIDIEAKNNLIEKLKKTQAEFETDKQAQSKLLRNLEARVRELFTTCNMDSADNCITMDQMDIGDILANIERMYLDLQKNETKLIIDRDRTNEQLQQEIHNRIQANKQLHNKDLELNTVKQEFEQRVMDYLQTIGKKDEENDHLKAKFESVLHNLDEHKSAQSELESKLKLANGKLIQLEQEITSSTEKFNLENANKIQLEQQLESVRQELSSQSSVQIRIGDELDSVKQKHHLLEIDIEAKNNLIEKLKKTQAEFETDKQAQSKLLRNLEARVRELFTTCNMDSADNCITIDDILANIERMYLDLQKNERKLILDRDRINEQLQQEIHARIQAKNQLHNKDLELNSVKHKLIEVEDTNQQLLIVAEQRFEKEVQEKNKLLERLETEKQDNLKNVMHLEDELKKNKEDIGTFQRSHSQLELENKKHIKTIADLEYKNKEMQQRLERELLSAKKVASELQTKCTLSADRLTSMEVKYSANESQMKMSIVKKEEDLQKVKLQLLATTKRLEKMAVQLGEQQSLLSKKERILSQAMLEKEEQVRLISSLQREKEKLQLELRQAKDLATRAEEKLELEKFKKVEKKREVGGLLYRQIQQQMNVMEVEKVNLNLQVGELNSNIAQHEGRTSELSHLLRLANKKLASMEKCNEEQLTLKNGEDMQKLEDLQQKLKEAQQQLDVAQLNHESMQAELFEKNKQLEQQLRDLKPQYQRKLDNFKEELSECTAELVELRNAREEMMETVDLAKDEVKQERSKSQQLELDCQILQAKYRDAKAEIASFEQKLKDQRLEMEGKLDKMKTKMRTLYTTEVTRMKEKQERDVANDKAELEKLGAQNAKYEEHTRKLSSQIVRLNEKILEQQKQHAILSTKLRHLQEAEQATVGTLSASDDWPPFKRPSAPSGGNLGSNLAMEDEEGEVFNNTYLTDLKLGRVPDMTAEELQYRNSLQPPHLKSAYAAQYDLGSQDDDLKDGTASLDDSMSALLSITGGSGAGTRKKSMGTHYKRPGPPTPSKNGGRLSFGSSEPPREILRETYENGAAKTPARFKLFASRFSMGSSGIGGGGHCLPRDEQPHQPRSRRTAQGQQSLLSGLHRRNLKIRAANSFCTSTPRKRRLYYDQQRMIIDCDGSDDQLEKPEEDDGTPHLSNDALAAMTSGQPRRINVLRRRSVTSTSSGSSAASKNSAMSSGRRKSRSIARVSLYLHGNIFAKDRTRVKTANVEQMGRQRSIQRNKVRRHRFECFDRGRQLPDRESDSDGEGMTVSSPEDAIVKPFENNNYSTHNHNIDSVMDGTQLLHTEHTKMEYMDSAEAESVLDQVVDAGAATFNVSPSTSAPYSASSRCNETQMALAATYNADKLDSSSDLDNHSKNNLVATWLCDSVEVCANHLTYDLEFEEICRQTTSTAPFELHPLQYNQSELQIEGHARTTRPVSSLSNMIATPNASTTTNASSCHSGTISTLSHRMPNITVTYMRNLSDIFEAPSQLHHITGHKLLWCGCILLLLLLVQYFGSQALGSATAAVSLLLSIVAYYLCSR